MIYGIDFIDIFIFQGLQTLSQLRRSKGMHWFHDFSSHIWRLHYGKATSPTCIINFSSLINKENELIHSNLCGPLPHFLLSWVRYHYKQLHPLKPYYPTTKTQKTTRIQALCNYLLGITTSVQLSPYKYGVLINKLPH